MSELLNIARNGVETITPYPFTEFGQALDTLLREREFWLHYRHFNESCAHFFLSRSYKASRRIRIRHWQQLEKPSGDATGIDKELSDVHTHDFSSDEVIYVSDDQGGYWHVPTGILLERFKNPSAQGIDIHLRESFTAEEPPHAALCIRALRRHDDRLSVDIAGNAFNPGAKDFLCTTLGLTPDSSFAGVTDSSDYSTGHYFQKEYPSETWATRHESTRDVMKILQELLKYEG